MDYNWNFKQFVMGVFSDEDAPSSSRILTFILGLGVLGILSFIFYHLMSMTPDKLILWLGALPTIIVTLVGVFVAPYTINRGTGSLADLATILKKKDGQ